MLKLKGVAIKEGVLVECYSTVFRVGIIAPVLPKIVAEAHFAIGHDWDSLGVGMISSASMDEQNQLVFEADLYPDLKEANALAYVVEERLKAGKKVSLSMGFFSAGWAFMSGAECLGWLAEQGDDLSQYDTASILAHTDWIYLITEFEPVEISYVLDGACHEAMLLSAKTCGIDENELLTRLDSWRAASKAYSEAMTR